MEAAWQPPPSGRRAAKCTAVVSGGGVRPGPVLGGPLGGRQRLHRQRVDLLAHSIAERRVDALVAGDAARALELGRDDGGEEVAAVALDLEVLAGAGRAAMKRWMSSGVGSAIGRCYRGAGTLRRARSPLRAATTGLASGSPA